MLALADARRRGATRWLVGGDVAAFGGWPVESVETLRALGGDGEAAWLRGNWERWVVERDAMPAVPDLHAAADAVSAALGPALVRALHALPESVALADDVRARHGSPASASVVSSSGTRTCRSAASRCAPTGRRSSS
jgi:hypothetical protein